jgi:CheY-like chemotaxis protein
LAASPEEAQAVQASALAPGARRLLLVDDNADSADVMGELLRTMGHQVHVAHDAEGAMALARAHPHDAIILDIGLPNIDGYMLARMMRADPLLATTRLIAHTGYGSDTDRQKTADAGFDFHLVKPADFNLLERTLAGL